MHRVINKKNYIDFVLSKSNLQILQYGILAVTSTVINNFTLFDFF